MKKAIMKKWVRALRSGEYKQGKEYLRDRNDNFCCLGVLCDISKQSKWFVVSPDEGDHPAGTRRYGGKKAGKTGILPESVLEWAGMKSEVGAVRYIRRTNLAQLNDEGRSFAEIADIIESNWEKL